MIETLLSGIRSENLDVSEKNCDVPGNESSTTKNTLMLHNFGPFFIILSLRL